MSNTVRNKPLVSIVMPTYNRAHVLPYAIRSILNQTYTELELIIVDDNSTDNTRDVIESFKDERIKYIKNEPNLKLPRALNKGFSVANGAYLTWTSDDNTYANNAIEKMVASLKTGNCDFVYADYFLFAELDDAGNPMDARHARLPRRIQLEKTNHIGACFLYTRKVYEEIGDYDPELFLVEDYDYFIRITKLFTTCHIPEPLYFFRRHDDALYCSRYAEVKAADALVRYKNALLNDAEVVDAVAAPILRNLDALKSPLLRWSYRAVRKVSYRLTNGYRHFFSKYLRWRLSEGVISILDAYRSGRTTFGQAKERLQNLMLQHGKVEYIQPRPGKSALAGKDWNYE
jgi:glycosyltransferase involved in cell wall biosynthesis